MRRRISGHFPKEVIMRLFNKQTLCALCLCTAALPLVANAADESKVNQSGFEFGAGAGGGQLSAPAVSDRDLGGFAYTFFGGYRFGRWAAVEASYLDGGEVSREEGDAKYKTEPHLATVTGMGSLPLTHNFSLFARAGVSHWWSTDEFDFVSLGNPTTRFRFSENATEPIWGAGMSLFVDRGLLRLEYDQSKANANVDGIPLDLKLRVLTLQVAWLL